MGPGHHCLLVWEAVASIVLAAPLVCLYVYVHKCVHVTVENVCVSVGLWTPH